MANKKKKIKAPAGKPLHVMLSLDQREHLDAAAAERDMSLKAYVIERLFGRDGTDYAGSVAELASRLGVLEARLDQLDGGGDPQEEPRVSSTTNGAQLEVVPDPDSDDDNTLDMDGPA